MLMKSTFADSSTKNQHTQKLKPRTGTVSKSFTELNPEPAEKTGISRTGPGTARYSESVLEPEPEQILTR